MEFRRKIFALPLCIVVLTLILAASKSAAAQEFIYTSDFAGNSISAFAFNTATGKVTELPELPFGAGGSGAAEGPINMAHSPDGRFVYVVFIGQLIDRPCGFNNGELLSYSVDPRSGALALIDEEVLSGFCAQGLGLDPTGQFIYAASFPEEGPKVGIIDGYRISNGHLMPLPGTPFASPIEVADGQNPAIANMVVSSDGRELYASDPNNAAGILIFDRDTKIGSLTFREAFNTNTPLGSIAITPSGKFLLAAGGSVMFEYEIGAHGELSPAPGQPFSVPGGAGVVAVSPDGDFAASVGQGISMQRENQHGRLSLVPGSPFGGPNAFGVAMTFDPSGRFLLLPGLIFRVHPETGALTKVTDFASGGDGITVLQPCKVHDERGNGKRDADGKDDDGKQDHDCNEGKGNQGRD